MRKRDISLYFGIALMLMIASVAEASGQSRIYGGRATGVILNGNPTLRAGDTGELPSVGGSIITPTPSSSLPGVTTGIILSSTSATGNAAQSSSTVNDVTINAGGYVITATSVTVRAQCICCPGSADAYCEGSTEIQGLSITDPSGNPVPVEITGEANQVVVLPNGAGTITINEQIGGPSGLSVNALHFNIASGGTTVNGIIASASTVIVCGTGGPSSTEVNVGGVVVTAGGQPIPGATLVLTNSEGQSVSTTSNNFGQFNFTAVMAGQTYFLQASRKGYRFESMAVVVNEDISDLQVRANP